MQWIQYTRRIENKILKNIKFPLIAEGEFVLSHPVVSANESYCNLVLEKSS